MTKSIVSKQGHRISLAATLLFVCVAGVADSRAQPLAIRPGAGEQLVYTRDEFGNQIPDFSNCGYASADEEIPDVPVRVVVTPSGGDDGPQIQAAIDAVAKHSLGTDGFRGAVLLAAGQFEVAGQLRISQSGI